MKAEMEMSASHDIGCKSCWHSKTTRYLSKYSMASYLLHLTIPLVVLVKRHPVHTADEMLFRDKISPSEKSEQVEYPCEGKSVHV